MNKRTIITANMSKADKEQLETLAKANGMKNAQFITHLIYNYEKNNIKLHKPERIRDTENKKETYIHLRTNEEYKAKVKQFAKDNNMSFSCFVRCLLKDYMEHISE